MSPFNDLDPSFRPSSNLELARRAPALDTLPPVLIPRRGGPLPPLLHCGYPLNAERLREISATKFGYISETATQGMIRFLEEAIGHTAGFELVWCEGKGLGFIALCNNFVRSPRLAETEPKLKELLEIEEPMRWYLDREHWYWKRR